ncbi:uncharacterized protein LOC109847487 [Asparagus officinalis]|uniref:uncharacterized protein LOC109847487 n=1 Tax=Asparagus officinalis TaxID=4686 RepID=UPI00098E7CE5|nr:uncharacterized protein LOC109847487 [Asparagus officinalis]
MKDAKKCNQIPSKYDGFPYGDGFVSLTESILVDAFLDPLCPDSRDSWPPLKKVIRDYSPHVSLIVHPFPLPYHDNSYLSCRALHIANKLNASATYPLLESFFKNQVRYSNAQTHNQSRASTIDDMANFAVMTVGNSFLPAFKSGFEDQSTDAAARISFKYGCSRGVYGTPFFFVNGFALPDAGSALDYKTWTSVIDPLVKKQKKKGVEDLLIYL